jgi:glycosyltransferase involved in cell wall biosynthesis
MSSSNVAPVPPRIAIDYRPALLGNAGIGRAVRELAAAIARGGGRDVELRLFGHCLAAARRATTPPARLHRLPIPGRVQPWLARLRLDAAALSGNAAVFHWTDTVHPPVHRAKTVLTVHDVAFAADPTFHGPAANGLSERCRAAVGAAHAIVVPTAATAADLRQHFAPAGPVHVVPFGADHVPASTAPDPLRGEPFVLAIGTIEPRKNHVRLLQAHRLLRTPRPRLVVVGRAGWECADAVAALRAAPETLWLTNADDATVFALLAHARALVYPTRYEGFGFPPLEALMFRTPVVAGDTPALREVLDDAAVFVDPTNAASIADGIARVLDDERLRESLRRRGPARAAAFRWQDCARRHVALYRELAGG